MVGSIRQSMQKLVSETIAKGVVSGGLKAATGPVGAVNTILGKVSKETLGYNFPGLISNIGVFYLAAFVIDSIFDAIITGGGFIAWIAKLAGKQLPPILPQPIIDFYKSGYKGFQFWDAVHIGAILLVVAEAYRYIKSNEETGGKPSYFTLGIFAMIIGAIFLLVGPSLYQKLKENGITTGFLTPNTSGSTGFTNTSDVNFSSVPPSPPGSGN